MRTALLCALIALFGEAAPAQEEGQNSPPPILRVFVERVKPGKGPAHERSEAAFAHVLSKANYPAHYLALVAMSGPDEVWYLEEHSSFAEVESSEKAGDAPGIKPELDQASATDGEYISSGSSMIGVYRPDLSYHATEGMSTMPKSRYFSVGTVRLKAGMDARLVGAVRDMSNIYSNVQLAQPIFTYQIISGAPGDTFLILEPFAALAEWDKYPAVMKSLRETGGRKFDQVEATLNEIVQFRESRLMSVSPRMSYVTKKFASADAEFWTPKPPTAAAKPKPRAAKPAGQ